MVYACVGVRKIQEEEKRLSECVHSISMASLLTVSELFEMYAKGIHKQL